VLVISFSTFDSFFAWLFITLIFYFFISRLFNYNLGFFSASSFTEIVKDLIYADFFILFENILLNTASPDTLTEPA